MKEMEIKENRIYNMDCVELMSKMEPESAALILSDPPYGLGFSHDHKTYNRDADNVLQGYQEIEPGHYLEFTRKWIQGASRVLKNDGTMYIVTGFTNLRHILNALEEEGLHVVNSLAWQYEFGVYTTRKWVNSHYTILMVAKNPKKIQYFPFCKYPEKQRGKDGKSLNYKDRESVWRMKREHWKNSLKTPTRLPYALIQKMIEYSSKKGDLVLDPFMGSGQTAFVAKDLKRKYIGAEVVKDYCDFANKRVSSGQYLIPANKETQEEQESWLKKTFKKITKKKQIKKSLRI